MMRFSPASSSSGRAAPSTALPWVRCASAVLMTGILLWLPGCAVSPQVRQSLTAYVSASEQVQQTAGNLLADYAKRSLARSASPQPVASKPAEEYPHKFDPTAVSAKPELNANERAIAETRLALAVIHDYDALLVALAEGRSEAEVQLQTGAFGGALKALAQIGGAVIPGIDAALGLAGKFIKLANVAANREELLRLVAESREPLRQILQGLEAETKGMYDTALGETNNKLLEIRLAIQAAASPLAKLCGLHAPPQEAAIVTKLATLEVQAAEVAKQTRTTAAVKIPFPFVAGRLPADAAAATQAEVFVQAMRIHAQRYAEQVAAQNAYYEVLVKYVAALDAMQAGFDTLAANLMAPVDMRSEIARLLSVGFELRDAVATYRNPTPATATP